MKKDKKGCGHVKIAKTNAMRILDQKNIPYEVMTYEAKDGAIDGVSVAKKIGYPIEMVYKTLVTQSSSKNFFVFVIPVDKELDLKKAAKSVGEKRVEMIAVKDITKYTGYVRGGCSPVGMKKIYVTTFHEDAQNLEQIIVSGGKIGLQIKLAPSDLVSICSGQYADMVKKEE